jgi:cytochrome c5
VRFWAAQRTVILRVVFSASPEWSHNVVSAQDIRFFQVITYVLAALVGFTVFIFILAGVVADNTQRDWRKSDPEHLAAIAARLAPVGQVTLQGGEKVTLQAAASSALTFVPLPASATDHGDAGHDETAVADAGAHSDDAVASADSHDAATDTASHGTSAPAEEAVMAQAGEMVEEAVETVTDAAGEVADAAAEAVETVADAAETTMAETSDAADAAGGEMADALAGIDGGAIYNRGCNACHAMGIAGAPKVGDAAAWEPRMAQGRETLYSHAINGWNTMPAKGGFAYLSDEEVMAAVNYMVDQL